MPIGEQKKKIVDIEEKYCCDKIFEELMRRSNMFNILAYYSKSLFYYKTLNLKQKNAVQKILTETSGLPQVY